MIIGTIILLLIYKPLSTNQISKTNVSEAYHIKKGLSESISSVSKVNIFPSVHGFHQRSLHNFCDDDREAEVMIHVGSTCNQHVMIFLCTNYQFVNDYWYKR